MNPNNIIQWFPGHMTKTNRMIQKNLSMVDVVVEIIDARIARSSKNPQLEALVGNKPRLIIINKCDLADDNVTSRWVQYYKNQGINVIKTTGKSGAGVKNVISAIRETVKEKIERSKAKGMVNVPIRVMIVGIPNVGKSSIINALAGSRRAKVEDRPGVTRGKQWITLSDGIELLDTPGVLWPKFENQDDARNIAYTGGIKDDVIDIEWLATMLLKDIMPRYIKNICERYKVEDPSEDAYELLEQIGRKRGMMMSGGHVNLERASIMIIDEYRGGKIGRLSLEAPEVK